MARKSFNTTIEETIVSTFKNTCNEYGIGMNIVLEALMTGFSNNKFVITLRDGKFIVRPKDD